MTVAKENDHFHVARERSCLDHVISSLVEFESLARLYSTLNSSEWSISQSVSHQLQFFFS